MVALPPGIEPETDRTAAWRPANLPPGLRPALPSCPEPAGLAPACGRGSPYTYKIVPRPLRLSGSNFIGEIGTKLEHKLEQ